MRVSVVNFCSTALEMLKFSTKYAIENAGTDDFDYFVVTWNPTYEVKSWIEENPTILRSTYHTNLNLSYVPNIRAMMNSGFDVGFDRNDYVVPINTDMMFGNNWLTNLTRVADENTIPSSVTVMPMSGPYIHTADFGIPTFHTFDLDKWKQEEARLTNAYDILESKNKTDHVLTPSDFDGNWKSCARFPYVIHRNWWSRFGPWSPEIPVGSLDSSDRLFFGRCANSGARLILSTNSLVYHYEAVERRSGNRPVGVEYMENGK